MRDSTHLTPTSNSSSRADTNHGGEDLSFDTNILLLIDASQVHQCLGACAIVCKYPGFGPNSCTAAARDSPPLPSAFASERQGNRNFE